MQGLGDPQEQVGAEAGLPVLNTHDDVAAHADRGSKNALRQPAMFADQGDPKAYSGIIVRGGGGVEVLVMDGRSLFITEWVQTVVQLWGIPRSSKPGGWKELGSGQVTTGATKWQCINEVTKSQMIARTLLKRGRYWDFDRLLL